MGVTPTCAQWFNLRRPLRCTFLTSTYKPRGAGQEGGIVIDSFSVIEEKKQSERGVTFRARVLPLVSPVPSSGSSLCR